MMQKEIIVLEDTDDLLCIKWESNTLANEYVLLGMNDLYNYEEVMRTNSNVLSISKKELKRYREIKISYLIQHNTMHEVILTSTSPLLLQNSYEEIQISSLKSYHGMALSFECDTFYDKYYLYEKKENNFSFILETEDFQIASSHIKKNHFYYVEGLQKVGEQYFVKGKSKEFCCQDFKLAVPKKVKLSIVVPTYNAQIFLARCFNSILFSKFQNYEIIVVDDGSTDQTRKIVEWYQKNYPNIFQVYYQENQGVSFARNKGIELAKGKYIAFLDHDDFVHPNMYELLYKIAEDENADVAIGTTAIRNGPNNYYFCLNPPNLKDYYLIYDYEKMMEEKNKCSAQNIFFVAIWNKIMKTDIVKKHPFILQNYYEDTAFTRTIYSYLNRFVFVPSAIYVWDKRFQQTIGTATNHYTPPHEQSLFLHQCYINSVFYALDHGNSERLEILVYDCLKEILHFLQNLEIDWRNSFIYDSYMNKILELQQQYHLMNNSYLLSDLKLYEYVKELLDSYR